MESTAVPAEETWNLADLFADDAAFEAAKRQLESSVAVLDRWRGRLNESAAVLADALEAITGSYKRFSRLRNYASMKSDGDTRDAAARAMRQGVELLATDLLGRISYLRPEILSLEPSVVEGFIAAEPRLAPHAFFLRDLLRQRTHVLSPAEERIIAETGLLSRAPNSLYNLLHNAELPRPEFQLDGGERIRLTPVEFHRRRSTVSRAERQRMFPAYFEAYSAFKETLGQNLYAAVKGHMFQTRVRGYDSCLAAALAPDNVPVEVYHNLISQVRERLPVIHRYFRLRARALDLDRLEYPDLYSPIGDKTPRGYSTAESRELVRAALAPLGSEYIGALDTAFEERWIDWHPAPGKRAGAYASGSAYDVHPYVLLNYTDNYESVSTLAHEMGHALHSYFSNLTQPYPTADYSIFVAEVASTLNEALLAARVIEAADSADEQLALLANHLDGIRGTLFRQTMFAEFELEIHQRAERGEVLTGESLNGLYLDLLRSYHGHDDGVVHIADEYAVEWTAVPHFYFDFYVYQYATGIVAATALADAVLDERPGAARRYREFLGSGGSDYPLELLRRAGVDLESRDPYDAALASMDRHLDRLEDLLDSSGKR